MLLFALTVIAFRWSAPVRSDQLNEAAGERQRCSFNHRGCEMSFCDCVKGKLGPLAVWSH